MVFPVLQQPRDSYRLWRPFTFPSSRGPVPAIAVPDSWRDPLTSLYTVLLTMVFIQSWTAFVAHFLRRDRSKPDGFLRTIYKEKGAFWKIFFGALGWDKSCFLGVLSCARCRRRGNGDKAHMQKDLGLRNILWLFGAGIAWLLPIAANPSLVKLFVIGIAAPANPNELYFPRLWDYSEPNITPETTNFFKQPVLRALSVEQLRSPATLDKVRLDQQTLATRSDGQKVLQYNYGYNVTSQDFGMQHFAGLSLTIQGSCYTEYGWIRPENNTETYYLWNEPADSVTVTQADTVVPRAWFAKNGSYDIGGSSNLAGNNTYAIWVSTEGRSSFTPSTDPWYFTQVVPNNSNTTSNTTSTYVVKTQRPVLSCWETSGYTYNGVLIGDPWYFIYNKPDLNFPNSTRTILYGLLWQPPIITTGQNLDTINLASSEQDIEYSFDANSSSIYQDLQRMLVTSYVWTTNILLDTSIRDTNTTYSIPNFIGDENRTQVADFVVTTSNVATVSLVFAIVVPCLAAVTYGLQLWVTGDLDDEEESTCEKCRRNGGGNEEAQVEQLAETVDVKGN